ncbi:MAG: type IV secretory system conjugative DNA transfer family protein [Bacilli bacterium]
MTPWSEKKRLLSTLTTIAITIVVCSCIVTRLLISKQDTLIVGLQEALLYSYDCIFFAITNKDFSVLFEAQKAPLILGLFLMLALIIMSVIVILAAVVSIKNDAYGDSRFATSGDLQEMGLLGNLGIILGKKSHRLLNLAVPRHVLVVAPNRTGKTAGVVIPSIIDFKGSTIVTDPKGELYNKLATPLRRRGEKVYCINWANPNSPDCWNPISAKMLPDDPVLLERHAERVAVQFYPKEGGSDSFWQDVSKKYFASLILYEIFDGKEKNKEPHIGDLYETLVGFQEAEEDEDPFGKHLTALAKRAHYMGWSKRITVDLNQWAGTSFKMRSTHLDNLTRGIQIMRSTAVRGSTRSSSFSFDELRHQKSTVFIQFPQQDAAYYGQLTALFFESFMAWALDTEMKQGEKPICIIADEFGSLPQIPLMSDFLSKGAGMGAIIMPIIQDFAQIEKTYGTYDLQTIRTNCTYTIAFSQNNTNTQKALTETVGKVTRNKKSLNRKLFAFVGDASTSINAEGVDLIRIEEWGSIPFGSHILIVQGHQTKPVYCKTPLYYKTPRYRRFLA